MGPVDTQLKREIQACTICAEKLPHKPRPITAWNPSSKILIIGQAPGRIVHETGIPWQDASGRLLREWLGITEKEFYDPNLVALMPMGFCFPGKGPSGDMAPRPECAPHWHPKILSQLAEIKLTLLIGKYAQDFYLREKGYKTLTENVREYRQFLPSYVPLPHPSPRNRFWLSKNPWFENELIVDIRNLIRTSLK